MGRPCKCCESNVCHSPGIYAYEIFCYPQDEESDTILNTSLSYRQTCYYWFTNNPRSSYNKLSGIRIPLFYQSREEYPLPFPGENDFAESTLDDIRWGHYIEEDWDSPPSEWGTYSHKFTDDSCLWRTNPNYRNFGRINISKAELRFNKDGVFLSIFITQRDDKEVEFIYTCNNFISNGDSTFELIEIYNPFNSDEEKIKEPKHQLIVKPRRRLNKVALYLFYSHKFSYNPYFHYDFFSNLIWPNLDLSSSFCLGDITPQDYKILVPALPFSNTNPYYVGVRGIYCNCLRLQEIWTEYTNSFLTPPNIAPTPEFFKKLQDIPYDASLPDLRPNTIFYTGATQIDYNEYTTLNNIAINGANAQEMQISLFQFVCAHKEACAPGIIYLDKEPKDVTVSDLPSVDADIYYYSLPVRPFPGSSTTDVAIPHFLSHRDERLQDMVNFGGGDLFSNYYANIYSIYATQTNNNRCSGFFRNPNLHTSFKFTLNSIDYVLTGSNGTEMQMIPGQTSDSFYRYCNFLFYDEENIIKSALLTTVVYPILDLYTGKDNKLIRYKSATKVGPNPSSEYPLLSNPFLLRLKENHSELSVPSTIVVTPL